MEPHTHEVSAWLMYSIGYIGLLYRMIRFAMREGKRLDVLFQYIKDNSLVVLSTIVVYNGVCAMWMWTSALEFFGLFRGELNGMTVLLGYTAEGIFKDAVSGVEKKLEQRRKERESNGKTSDV